MTLGAAGPHDAPSGAATLIFVRFADSPRTGGQARKAAQCE
jgi:hypothetical protein